MVFKNTRGLDVGGLIVGIILLVILFSVAAESIPEVNTAGDALNATGVPFGNFFASNGLIVLGLMAVIILVVFASMGLGKRSK